MMELVKKNIHMNRWKGNAATQITLDDDFIVPDTLDDVAQVILDSGDVQVEAVKNQGEKVLVRRKTGIPDPLPQGRGRASDYWQEIFPLKNRSMCRICRKKIMLEWHGNWMILMQA